MFAHLIPLAEVLKDNIPLAFPYIPYGALSVLSLEEAKEAPINLQIHGCLAPTRRRKSWRVIVSYTTLHGDPMIRVAFKLVKDPDGKLFANLSNVTIPVAATAVYLEK